MHAGVIVLLICGDSVLDLWLIMKLLSSCALLDDVAGMLALLCVGQMLYQRGCRLLAEQ